MSMLDLPSDLPAYYDIKVGDLFATVGLTDKKEEHVHFHQVVYKNSRIAEIEYRTISCNMHGKHDCKVNENHVSGWNWFENNLSKIRWMKSKAAAILFADKGAIIRGLK